MAFINGLAACALAVRDAAHLEPESCQEAAGTAALPKWSDVPKECGFKLAYRKMRGGRKRPTDDEERADQCRGYRLYTTWARRACTLTERELKAELSAALEEGKKLTAHVIHAELSVIARDCM